MAKNFKDVRSIRMGATLVRLVQVSGFRATRMDLRAGPSPDVQVAYISQDTVSKLCVCVCMGDIQTHPSLAILR